MQTQQAQCEYESNHFPSISHMALSQNRAPKKLMIDHHFSDLNNHVGAYAAYPHFQQKESFHNPTSIGDTVAHPKALQPVKPWQKQRANKELTMGKRVDFTGFDKQKLSFDEIYIMGI